MNKLNLYEVQKEKLIRQAAWMAEQTDDWMMIRDYMNNRLAGVQLNERQKEKQRRYQYAYNQLCSGKYTESEVIEQITEHFNVADSTAIQDIKCSREIYNTTLAIDKRFEIKMQIEFLKIEQQKARETGNMDAYAKLAKCVAEFIKMSPDDNLDKEEYFQPRQNIMQFNPAILGIPAINTRELSDLLQTLKSKYNFKMDTSFIEEAEIIVDDAD